MGLRVVLLATASFAVPTLEALRRGPDALLAVFTRPDRPAGRGLRLRPSPVKSAAQEMCLPIHQPERVSRGEGLELLRQLAPDVVLAAAFGEILKPALLSLPRIGPINLHASLLPRYRGAAPIQRALLAGEEETGVTAQWMAEGLDTGDVIVQRALAIGPEEDFGVLHARLATLAAEVATETLGLLRAGAAPRVAQCEAEATLAPPIRPDELEIDWRRPAVEIHRQVRAFAPSPGARTMSGGKLLKILTARLVEGTGGRAGEIVEITSQGLRVETGSASLLVLRVQPEGRTAMSAGDYARGHRVCPGQVLGR